MAPKATFLSLLAALLPLQASAAFFANWEGSHIDVASNNRAIDWWYTQIVGQTPAANGIPPSIEVVLKHGNTFQFGPSNGVPLYLVEVNGFGTDGTAFAQTLTFNTSTVAPTGKGFETTGSWGADEVTFCASSDLKKFTIHLNTSSVTGTIVINSNGHFRTGCGDTDPSASPFFDGLVSDGRPLTDAEVILYQKTGWRITAPGGSSTVDLKIAGKAVKFTGFGYKDSNWGPNAMNDFIRSWYVLIAELGPYSFVTFSGQATTGGNRINSGHLSINGKFVTSQCNIIGERNTDISIITPSGEVADNGVTAPTGFNLTFVLPSSKPISFQVTNVANSENPGVSIYHRWVGKYTGGAAGEHYVGYGITEWMNPANLIVCGGAHHVEMHSLATHLLSLSTTTPYQAATNHEFLTSAGRNTLKQDRLSFWLAQDRIYAAHAYPKFIGSLIGSIPYNSSDGLESARELLNQRILKTLVFCLDNIVKEVTFFNTTASQWNLDLQTWQERKETRDYTAEMARIGSSGRIEDGLIFLWAMEKVYLDAWTYVAGLGSASGAVTAFSANWSSPEFVRFVNELASLVDALEIAPGSDACNRAEKIWNRVVELEEMFWPREEEETLAASRKI